MSTQGSLTQPARQSARIGAAIEQEKRDFALARDRRRKANKAATAARRKNRR